MDWLTRLRQLPVKRRSLLLKIFVSVFTFGIVSVWLVSLPKLLAQPVQEGDNSLYQELVKAADEFANQATNAKQQIDEFIEKTDALIEQDRKNAESNVEANLAEELERKFQISLALKNEAYQYSNDVLGFTFEVPAGVAILSTEDDTSFAYSFCYDTTLQQEPPCSSLDTVPMLLVETTERAEDNELLQNKSLPLQATSTVDSLPAEEFTVYDDALEKEYLIVTFSTSTHTYLFIINTEDETQETLLNNFRTTFTFQQ